MGETGRSLGLKEDRPLLYLWTVHFHTLVLRTVHFWSIIHFLPWRSSSRVKTNHFLTHCPLWTRVFASEFLDHKFRQPHQAFLIFAGRSIWFFYKSIKKQNLRRVRRVQWFLMALSKILHFFIWAQNSLLCCRKILVMIEKAKTVIRCYFLLPDFSFRGHPNLDSTRKSLHGPCNTGQFWMYRSVRM